MILVMPYELLWMLLLVSGALLATLATVLFGCVCWKHKTSQHHKNDLLGLDGMVKITNPDENVNHVTYTANHFNQTRPSSSILLSSPCTTNTTSNTRSYAPTNCVSNATNPNTDQTNNFLQHKSKVNGGGGRPSGGSNSNRSLPDIPRVPDESHVTADTNSEIYATVEDKNTIHPSSLQSNVKCMYDFDDDADSTILATPPAPTILPTGDGIGVAAACYVMNGVVSRPSLSQQSSLSQADAPYARLKCPEHPYDKLKKEHPYASVQKQQQNNEQPSAPAIAASTTAAASSSGSRTSNEVLSRLSHDSAAAPSGGGVSLPPVAPPRLRRTSSLSSCQLLHSIPASVAVAGQIAANQEIPYMTPPLLVQQPPAQQQVQHFSGDSQDSSKGYTSISVREPLANILAQTQTIVSHNNSGSNNGGATPMVAVMGGGNATNARSLMDTSHYATVSDDSDEMYAAIDEPSTLSIVNSGRMGAVGDQDQDIYTSGSETYAQILQPITSDGQTTSTIAMNKQQSVVGPAAISTHHHQVNHNVDYTPTSSASSSICIMKKSSDDVNVLVAAPPQPPSVDSLKQQVTALQQQHSRQSSSSNNNAASISSSSPKPEKRQANSPLPPRPFDNATGMDLLVLNNNNNNASSAPINLEDMYAKVHKNTNKKKLNAGGGPVVPVNNVVQVESTSVDTTLRVQDENDPGYETLLHKNTIGLGDDVGEDDRTSLLESDPNYEVLKPNVSINNNSSRNSIIMSNVDVVDEPNYESMPHDDGMEPTYESVSDQQAARGDCDDDIDVNYASIKKRRLPPDDCGDKYSKL